MVFWRARQYSLFRKNISFGARQTWFGINSMLMGSPNTDSISAIIKLGVKLVRLVVGGWTEVERHLGHGFHSFPQPQVWLCQCFWVDGDLLPSYITPLLVPPFLGCLGLSSELQNSIDRNLQVNPCSIQPRLEKPCCPSLQLPHVSFLSDQQSGPKGWLWKPFLTFPSSSLTDKR
jgi:hypothetical protein